MNDSTKPKLDSHIQELHDKACEKGEESYIDPATGYLVFTKLFHLKRGYCCNSGCRHCPWRSSTSDLLKCEEDSQSNEE